MLELRICEYTRWVQTRDGDPGARQLYERHYSCRQYRDGRVRRRIIGPGEYLLLVLPDYTAICAWRRFLSLDFQEGINCCIFRNESQHLSSELILDAESWATRRWPKERRLYTYVNPWKVRSPNPGFCFKAAGWSGCGLTKSGLVVLEKVVR